MVGVRGLIDVSVTRLPEKNGPGLLFILVALVVAAVVGAKLFGFGPGGKWSLPRGGGGTQLPPPGSVDKAAPAGRGPAVILYHAHTRENFAPKPPHEPKGTGDVVTVGEALARALEEQGLPVLHLKGINDLPRWEEAFGKARRSLLAALADAPNVQAIIDLHRDALENAAALPADSREVVVGDAANDGAGRPARILLVVGDADNQEAALNLAFAQRLKAALDELAPDLARGVRVLHRAMNDDLHANSVQVYIGEYKQNTLAEAQAAARAFAQALSRVLKSEPAAPPAPAPVGDPAL